jgi:putative ABC transport system ATP-binding protein
VTHDRGIASQCERRITIEAGRVGFDDRGDQSV